MTALRLRRTVTGACLFAMVGLSGTRGVVIVELVDAGTGKVAWSGRARSSADSPQKLQKKARKMLERLIAALG